MSKIEATQHQVETLADALMSIGHEKHWWPSTPQQNWRELEFVDEVEFLRVARVLCEAVLNAEAKE